MLVIEAQHGFQPGLRHSADDLTPQLRRLNILAVLLWVDRFSVFNKTFNSGNRKVNPDLCLIKSLKQ